MKKEIYTSKFWKNLKSKHRTRVQRNVKDRLFRFLFANDKEALLQLYNALNGTDYHDASKLQVVTIESAVYIVMKNDLAFVLAGTLNMYEHQSTYSPNLPVRFLIYLAQEYQSMIEEDRESIYGSRQIELPVPQCIVFYNGQKDVPEEQTLKLSDAFGAKKDKADVELTVRIYNINYGHNQTLMEKCRMLGEYSKFVNIARKYTSENADAKEALSDAIDYCIEHGILEDILRKNQSEVLGMLLEEFDVEKYERTMKREGQEEGIEQGLCMMIESLQESGQTRQYTVNKVAEKLEIPEKEAELKVEKYWKT